ncbi:hypothetical protein Tco_0280899 [Tanacetum coccineum]
MSTTLLLLMIQNQLRFTEDRKCQRKGDQQTHGFNFLSRSRTSTNLPTTTFGSQCCWGYGKFRYPVVKNVWDSVVTTARNNWQVSRENKLIGRMKQMMSPRRTGMNHTLYYNAQIHECDTNITIASSDISYDRAQDDQDETDDLDQERDLLASF